MEQITTEQLTPEQLDSMYQQNTIATLTDAVQTFMDNTVRTRNYDNLLSACTYATSVHPPFQNEGQACVEWRDNVWMHCYQVMGEALAGIRTIPSESELIASLPTLNW